MLQLVPCPHCGQQSLLPHDTSLEASLKCPHCGGEMVLGEALLEQFSSWEVVSDPAVTAAPIESPFGQLTERPDIIPVPQADETREDLSLAGATETASHPSAPAVNVRPYTHFEYERMRRKQKSPIWSVLPVVLGGIAAFPIALLILWYGLGRDVGDMGPKIAAYVPWIVPKQFHPAENLPRPSRKRSIPQNGESGLPQVGETNSPLQPQNVTDADSVEATVNPKSVKNQTVEKQPISSEGSNDKPITPTKPTVDVASVDSTLPANQNLFLSIREAKEFLAELVKALEPTATDAQQLSRERQKEVFVSAYERLASVAAFCSQIDKDNPVHKSIREQMQPIARMIQQSIQFQAAFDNVTKGRASEATTGGFTGIAMILKDIEVDRQSDFWIVTGTHPLPSKTMIEVPRSLAPNLVNGQGLFALGVLVTTDGGAELAAPRFRVTYLHSM